MMLVVSNLIHVSEAGSSVASEKAECSNQFLRGLNVEYPTLANSNTGGECKTSNTHKNLRCENLPNQFTGIQAMRFC